MRIVGGREIHPINLKVGGFYRLPACGDIAPLADQLRWARDAAVETVRFAATLPVPDFELDYNSVSLREPDQYPLIDGRLVSTGGLDIGRRSTRSTSKRSTSSTRTRCIRPRSRTCPTSSGRSRGST